MFIVNHFKTLLLATLAAFVVSALLDQFGSSTISSDALFTMLVMGYILYLLRRKADIGTPPSTRSPAEEDPAHATPPDGDDTADSAPRTPQPTPWSPPRSPSPPVTSKPAMATGRIIRHQLPWAVVESGQPVGQFRHVPIPAWIRTSDNRRAEYAGIALNPPPEGCVCLEIPDQAELILPPGLIYAIRS